MIHSARPLCVHELPQSLSRFQRFCHSFFRLPVPVVFVGRDLHRGRSPNPGPRRLYTHRRKYILSFSSSLSLFLSVPPAGPFPFSVSFYPLPTPPVAFLISAGRMRKLFAEDMGRPPRNGKVARLDSRSLALFSLASALPPPAKACTFMKTVYVVQTMSSAALLHSRRSTGARTS